MTMKIVRLVSFLFAFALAASAFCVDFTVLAGNSTSQNTNSSTTATQNSNTGQTPSGRRRRQKRPAAASTAETPATSTGESTSMAASTTEQTDLSGTYTGTFDCSDAGVSGETTLTVTGNQFTLTDGKSGRIVASTTRGYTAVAMQFGELATTPTAQPGTPPVIVSMRAKKSGDRLTLTTVPGATHVCSFTPSGASRRARSRKTKPVTPAAVPEPVTPAEPTMAPPASAGPEPPATPAPRRRGRRGRRSNQNTNTNSNMNTNTNTGTGNENTTATPTPTPGIHRN
jgi:hypothetical protein